MSTIYILLSDLKIRINPETRKLIKLTAFTRNSADKQMTSNKQDDSILDNNLGNTFSKRNSCFNKKHTFVLVYDVETKETKFVEVNFFFLQNLESYSQVFIENTLYLCGKYGNEENGSNFLKVDLLDDMKKITMLVNSTYSHYRPSMTIFKKDYIIAVGGQDCIKCEIFHRSGTKWRILPDLPEERYGGSLTSDDKNDSLYLIGGFSSENNSYCSSLLKLNLKTGFIWETVIVKSKATLLARGFHCSIKYSSNLILLVGGGVKNKDCSVDIVEFDLVTKSAQILDISLEKPAKFVQNTHVEYDDILYLLDEDEILHKINRKDEKVEYVMPFEEFKKKGNAIVENNKNESAYTGY